MGVVTGLLNEYNAAFGDVTLGQRVQTAVMNAASAVASEATTTVNHTNRSTLAKAVTQPGAILGYGESFAQLIFALGTTDGSLDTSIQSAVNSVWNVVAGGL